MNKKVSLITVWVCCLLVLSLTAGCKAKTITVPVTIVKPVVTTVAVTKAPVTTPKLNTVTITLAIVAPNEYVAYVLPLWLNGDTMLHMSWKVEGGPFRMTMTTPSGQVVPVSPGGAQTSGTAGPLGYSGGIVFCTSDAAYSGLAWGDGYFNFTPNLIKGDAPVKITLNYYFETKPVATATSTVSTTPSPATIPTTQ